MKRRIRIERRELKIMEDEDDLGQIDIESREELWEVRRMKNEEKMMILREEEEREMEKEKRKKINEMEE